MALCVHRSTVAVAHQHVSDQQSRPAQCGTQRAKLAFLPGISFTPQGTISSWDYNKAVKTYQLPISASWDANLFGNLTAAKRAAQVSMLQTKDYQVAVQTKLIANVANMYYTLLMLDKQLQIVTDMEKLTKDTWEIMKIQHQSVAGVRSTAVQSAEANYLSVQTQKEDLKRQIRETENSLSLLLGQQAHAIPRGDLDSQNLPTNFSTGVGIQLLSNRADVHANEMALAKCFYNIEAARARFYPSLTISATGAFTNSGGLGITNPGKMLWNAVASLTCGTPWLRSPSLSSPKDSSKQDCASPRISTSRPTTLGRTVYSLPVVRSATHWCSTTPLMPRVSSKRNA